MMPMLRRARVMFVCAALALAAEPSTAAARGLPSGGRPHDGGHRRMDAAGRVGPAMGRMAIQIPATRARDFQAALRASAPEVAQCIEEHAPGPRTRVRLRARLSQARGLVLDVTPAPASEGLRACADVAARRRLVPFAGQRVVGTWSATLQVRGKGPAPAPMPPPTDPDRSFTEQTVHALLDATRPTLLGCISDLAPGMPGQVTLRVSVQADGRMTLQGVELPSGVRGPGSLACLAGHVGALRAMPSGRARVVVHPLRLDGR